MSEMQSNEKRKISREGCRIPHLAPLGLINRATRLFWHVTWVLFARPTPVIMHRWRCSILRIFGARIQGRCFVYPSTQIWAPWNLHMEDGSCLAAGVDCYNVASVRVGRNATVSQRSYLCTASHDFDDPCFPLTGAPIVIGDGAWVAAEVFVGPGVTVGENAVLLARSVVTRDVSCGDVVAGNPAQKIRIRFRNQGQMRGIQ